MNAKATTKKKAAPRAKKTKNRIDEISLDETAEILKAVAHPLRLKILQMLLDSKEPLFSRQLEMHLPVKQPTVSHHLKILKNSGVLESRKEGLWIYYSPVKEYKSMLNGLFSIRK